MLEPDISERFTRPEQIQKALELNHFESSPLVTTQTQSHALSPANLPQLNALITNPPVANPVSKIQIHGDTLSIDIHVPRTKRWLEPAVVVVFAIIAGILLSTGVVASDLVCFGTPFVGLLLYSAFKTMRTESGSGAEKLVLSPQGVQLSSGTIKITDQSVVVRKHATIPMSKLRNCYHETVTEEAAERLRAGVPTSSSTASKTSGIYFIDDDETEHIFRTTGITGRGQLLNQSADALPETQWLFTIVQTYLKNVSSPTLPHDLDSLETEKADPNSAG